MLKVQEQLDSRTSEILDILRNEGLTRSEMAKKYNVSLGSVKAWCQRNVDSVKQARLDFKQKPISAGSIKIKTKQSKSQTILDAHESLILNMISWGKTGQAILDELSSRIKDHRISAEQLKYWRELNRDKVQKALSSYEVEEAKERNNFYEYDELFEFLDKFRAAIVVMYSLKSMHPKTIASKISRSSGVCVLGPDISSYLREIPLQDRETIINDAKSEDEFFDPDAGILDSVLKEYKEYVEAIPAPEFSQYNVARSGSNTILVAPFTDLHIGEVIRPQDVRNRNEYSIDIARNRIEYWHDSVIEYAKRNRIKKIQIPMLGDLVNGELHHQQFDKNNEAGSIIQMLLTYEWLEKVFLSFCKHFESIEVYNVVGNHGRSPKLLKMPNFDFENNFDYGVCYLLQHRFQNSNIKFVNSKDIYAEMPIGNKNAILMHGWQKGLSVKSRYPDIINRLRQVIPEQFDYLMIGHFHHLHMSSIGHRKKFFICGSLKGVDGFARNDRFLDGDPEHFLLNFDNNGELRECVCINFTNLPKKSKRTRVIT